MYQYDAHDQRLVEERARPDARELQQVRATDRACREHDAAMRSHLHHLAPLETGFDPHRPRALEGDASHLGPREHGEVRPPAHGMEKRLGRVPAPAGALIDLEVTAALVVPAVEVVGARDPDLPRRLAHCIEQIPR